MGLLKIRLLVEIECRELDYGVFGKKPCDRKAIEAIIKNAFHNPYAPKGVKIVKIKTL